MTRFTAEWGAVSAAAFHTILELAVMRIRVTRGAGAVVKMKWQNFVGAMSDFRLVAVVAGYRHVTSRQGKLSLGMLGDGKERSVKITNGVATLAPVVIRCSRELSIVRIFVAIGAIRELHLIDRIFASGNVALSAFHRDVLPFKRVL